ncbi:MAG: hypothetical protein KGL39_06830 [Patescibacteria group bacterium]|nr:hypothetical protein [Patescibacteria group bacterium]
MVAEIEALQAQTVAAFLVWLPTYGATLVDEQAEPIGPKGQRWLLEEFGRALREAQRRGR